MVPDRPVFVPRDEASSVDRREDAAHDHAHLTDAIRSSGPAKHIARAAGVSVNTAKRYRNGRTLPDGLRLTRLARWSKPIRDAVIRLMGLDQASMDALQVRLEQESHRDRAETSRIGGAPDARTETMEGAATGEVVGRHGSAL